MNVNPGVQAYTNLVIDETAKPKNTIKKAGLLSRDKNTSTATEEMEPIDVVREYVTAIRRKRNSMKNG
jgi:hypothetical protein|tara:strand:- start:2214 stop:2417 length:204 start_codon:yes stop_codon:yes gene_type:complete